MRQRYVSVSIMAAILVTVGLLLFLIPGASAAMGHPLQVSTSAPNAQRLRSTQVAATQPFTSYLPLVQNLTCRIGSTVEDALDDVIPAHADMARVDTEVSGNTLTATFHLRDVPPTLPFNRSGVPRPADPNRCTVEYSWEMWVDVDNDRTTGGPEGHEYILLAWHCVRQGMQPTTQPLPDGAEQVVWEWRYRPECYPRCYTFYASPGKVVADTDADTLTLHGPIPGISAASVYVPFAFDYYPDGDRQLDSTECGLF